MKENHKNMQNESELQRFEISERQKEYIIEMLCYCFPKFTENNYPHFIESSPIIYFNEQLSLTWLEVLIKNLAPIILKSNNYWRLKFFDIAFTIAVDHPVDILYDKYTKLINNESFNSPMIPISYEKEDNKKDNKQTKKQKNNTSKMKDPTKEESIVDFFE